MSYLYVPSQVRIPSVPNMMAPEGYWRGRGADEGLVAFESGSSSWGRHLVTEGSFCYSLVVDDRYTLAPVNSCVNGYIYWEYGGNRVYYTKTYGWVWMRGMFAGYEPLEERTRENGEYVYEGDSFYVVGSFPYNDTMEVELTPRGALYGGDPIKMKASWKRWSSDTEFGRYEPQGEASGYRYVGLPRFTCGEEEFIRSFETTGGRYSYGRIHYSHADSKWVIGTVGSEAGWHEGSEPQVDSSVTFSFCRNEGSEVEGESMTVSYKDHVKGSETAKAYLGEAAVWR